MFLENTRPRVDASRLKAMPIIVPLERRVRSHNMKRVDPQGVSTGWHLSDLHPSFAIFASL